MKDRKKKRETDTRPAPGIAIGVITQGGPAAFSLAPHWVGGLLLLATFLLCVSPLMDTDLWWHLRTGQLIWERGVVPKTDWFLFTDSDKPWIDLHWGFQLLVAGLYALGGVNLIILFKAAVITAAVGIAWSAAGKELPAWLRAAVWIPAIVCITGRGYERPEMLSQLFLAGWLWVALRVETRPRWVWALPLIQVVWINCHALYVLGLVVGACFAVDYALRRLASGRGGWIPVPAELTFGAVLGSGAACALAALVNPYLVEGALFPLVLYRKFSVEQAFYAVRIGEFQRPIDFLVRNGFVNIYLNTQLLLVLIGGLSFLARLAVIRRWSPFRLLMFIGFLNLGWEASRNVNIFAFVTAVVTVANLADAWRELFTEEDTENTRPPEKPAAAASLTPETALSHPLTRRLNLLASGLLFVWIVATVTGVWGRFAGEGNRFGLGERTAWFTHEASQFAGQPGFPDRAFVSHIGMAAVYEFHNGPERKVFMDPRLEVATPQTLVAWEQILAQMAAGDRSWEPSLLDAAGNLPVVILDSRASRTSINGLLLTPGWRLVYADPAAAVFLSEPQALALQLPAVAPTPLLYPP